MRSLTKCFLIAAATLCLSACDDKDEPQVPVELEVLPSDIEALTDIYNELMVYADDYPSPWSPDDRSTWKNAGIELNTLTGNENQPNYLVVSSITLYLPRKSAGIPKSLRNLSGLKDLKIYGCTGSILIGQFIPETVESILIDRLNPDDPGYMEAQLVNGTFYLGPKSMEHPYQRIVIHGVNMKKIDCLLSTYASQVDLSHNTLEFIGAGVLDLKWVSKPIDLSFNRITKLQWGWDYWYYWSENDCPTPDLKYNLLDNIPEKILKSEFWKDNHEKFIGNPGYVAPEV